MLEHHEYKQINEKKKHIYIYEEEHYRASFLTDQTQSVKQ